MAGNKVVHIRVVRENGDIQEFKKASSKWLFIATDAENNVISLSGNDEKNAYLLRVLENAVVQTMLETHRYGQKP